MIPLIVGAGIIGKFLYDINESHSMEEEAEEKTARGHCQGSRRLARPKTGS
ncbi:hypothetical protein [Dialister sp.]|uniref:hypothetical protein n=1 Tax=Dialister sp. TaxID=1955814 RepID=UPI00406D50C7